MSGLSGKCSDDMLNVLFLTLVSSLEGGATSISNGISTISYYDFVQIGRGWCLGLVHSLAGLLFQPRFKHHLTVNVRFYISYFYHNKYVSTVFPLLIQHLAHSLFKFHDIV